MANGLSVKDRATGRVSARVIDRADAATLVPFVEQRTDCGALVFSDGHAAYSMLARRHEVVAHSVGEYVRGMAHTNGIESFWALMKRGYAGTFHHMSAKHLHRYVAEFEARHNQRVTAAKGRLAGLAAGCDGKRLDWATLTR
ncbi:IS1595 family transposase [Candidatus Poriferisodalis sp.]|uniref:IS1595 family transposase n=1 Tax=Candidatus Poriferisodalis sp. TaxID=3101277 RepID=UPI003AF56FC0